MVGALNLFRTVAGALDEADIKAAQALSDAAAIAILQQRALTDARLLAAQLQTACSPSTVESRSTKPSPGAAATPATTTPC